MKLSTEELHVLQHSLGLDEYGRGTWYRNRFVTDYDSDDGAICLRLVAMGLMVVYPGRAISGEMPIFAVTVEGKQRVKEESPTPPKVSRSRARYLEWLRIADCNPDRTFGEWLKQEHGPAKARRIE